MGNTEPKTRQDAAPITLSGQKRILFCVLVQPPQQQHDCIGTGVSNLSHLTGVTALRHCAAEQMGWESQYKPSDAVNRGGGGVALVVFKQRKWSSTDGKGPNECPNSTGGIGLKYKT